LHVAQIGVGRVGRPTAYAVMCAGLAETLTVCDVKPGLAVAFAEELTHVTASIGFDVEINACERDEEVSGADLILISAGEPRTPGVKMSRRDLAVQKGKIMKYIAETVAPRNPGAKYVVISNPVEAMAMVCKKYAKADFVISTGTNLESLRFRSKIARTLHVQVSHVQGWVGGEHRDAALPLWSTTKINDLTVDEYATTKKVLVPKNEIASYVKSVSKLIVDNIGGTEYGPAASFRDIARAIINNTNETLSIAAPVNFEEIPEAVFVGIPTHLGSSIGASLYDGLSLQERDGIKDAAKAIYQTYQIAINSLEG
jgi:malate dehydrogenase